MWTRGDLWRKTLSRAEGMLTFTRANRAQVKALEELRVHVPVHVPVHVCAAMLAKVRAHRVLSDRNPGLSRRLWLTDGGGGGGGGVAGHRAHAARSISLADVHDAQVAHKGSCCRQGRTGAT